MRRERAAAVTEPKVPYTDTHTRNERSFYFFFFLFARAHVCMWMETARERVEMVITRGIHLENTKYPCPPASPQKVKELSLAR